MDGFKYHEWDVSRSVCRMGPGRIGNYDRRLFDRAYCQEPGEAGHVFPEDHKKERL